MMSRIGFALSGLAVAGLLIASACSPSGESSSQVAPAAASSTGGQQVTITVGNSMSFEPNTITVHADQPVELTLQNTGVMPHDFTLNDGVAQPVKMSAAGGQAANSTFTVHQPGTYTFICSMPGHAPAGMRGTITAE